MITTILNCYRRPNNLFEQIDAIKQQGIDTKIWIWANYHEDNKSIDYSKYKVDCVISSSVNFKYHGRFTCGLLANTEYLAYFDDDTIPGKEWFSNCIGVLDFCKSKNLSDPILGSAGVVLHNERYMHHTRVGWPAPNNDPTIVDLVGHAWFFKKNILKYLWYEDPISLDNGEDIQLSYLAMKYNNSLTICPPHPVENKELWGSIKGNELGIDSVASSNNTFISHKQFFDQRDYVVNTAISRGWKPIFMRQNDN